MFFLNNREKSKVSFSGVEEVLLMLNKPWHVFLRKWQIKFNFFWCRKGPLNVERTLVNFSWAMAKKFKFSFLFLQKKNLSRYY
jgi:hypothetical protein